MALNPPTITVASVLMWLLPTCRQFDCYQVDQHRPSVRSLVRTMSSAIGQTGESGLATTVRTISHTIVPPTYSQVYTDFEFSLHLAPKSLRRELISVFPDATIDLQSPLFVVPTFQKAGLALLQYGEAEAAEKDRLLERFFTWCVRVVQEVRNVLPDAWIDATDPASGMAWRGSSGSCYSDVDGIVRLLRYPTMDMGGCRVVTHPQWRFALYPATLFTTAPQSVIVDALHRVNQTTLSDHQPSTCL